MPRDGLDALNAGTRARIPIASRGRFRDGAGRFGMRAVDKTTSIYLDLIRPLAALAVLLSHISETNLSGGRLEFFASAGTQAVDIFFVLSGFVIAHVTTSRERVAHDYMLARCVRIYSVAIPALIVGFALDSVGMRINPAPYVGSSAFQDYSGTLLVRSVFFVGEIWQAHRFPGSNGPYWSLGFEVWYYVIFAAIIFLSGRWRWAITAALLILVGPKIAIMFPTWLLGVFTYKIVASRKVSEPLGWVLLIVPLGAFVAYQFIAPPRVQQFMPVTLDGERWSSLAQDYLLCALFAAHLVGLAAVSRHFETPMRRVEPLVRWVAGSTFSIYLMHLPILFFLAAISPWGQSSDARLALLLIGAPALCLLFAEVSERRKAWWRRLFERASSAGRRRCRAIVGMG